MKAMVLDSARPVEEGPLRVAERPTPTPAAGELLIRVEACAVCRTDLQIVEGDLAARAATIVPGHQVVGRVEWVGEGVTGWLSGERAGVAWLADTCGRCRFCA
jgi:propanol-preferring alcohol dehydrogenase